MRYRVDLTDLDFGEVQFDSSHEREFIIENTSPVQFDFSVDLSKVSRPGVVTVLPDSGGYLPFLLVLVIPHPTLSKNLDKAPTCLRVHRFPLHS